MNERKAMDLSSGKYTFLMSDDEKIRQVELIEVLGQGGCGIAYKAIVNPGSEDKKRVGVVKEYFPLQDNLKMGLSYTRDPETGRVCIETDRENDRAEELERQKKNVDREIRMSNSLFLEVKNSDMNNNPHFYQASYLTREGDSYYILLDTEKGATLKAIMHEQPCKRLTIKKAVHYSKLLLSIMKNNFENRYIHGDLKPENIWITDPGGAEGMVILDFGSVFAYSEYKKDISAFSEQQMLQHADKIIENEGIGCGSEGFMSSQLKKIRRTKTAYVVRRNIANATNLIQSMNEVNSSADIYSCIQMMFYLATGEIFEENGDYDVEEVGELIPEDEAVLDLLLEIMKKNEQGEYETVDEICAELECLEKLIDKDADPRVLIQGIKNSMQDITIHEELIAAIK